MSLADEIIEGIHDVIPDNVEALIPDTIMESMEGAVTHAVEELGEKLPDSVEKIAEGVVDKLND